MQDGQESHKRIAATTFVKERGIVLVPLIP